MPRHQSSHRKVSSQPSAKANPDALRSRPFAPTPESQESAPASLAPASQPAEFSILEPSGSRPQPIQAKLTIGAPGDKYEQEADRVAAQVVQQINHPKASQPQGVQREAVPEEEELQMKLMLQRMEIPEEEELQMKPSLFGRGVEGDASPDLEVGIQNARGNGQALAADLQAQMGQAMGADFSGVRVHTDTQSDQLNRSIQAKAFTTGQDVFFRQGAYQPGSRGGQELIAHELTHVLQQNGQRIQENTSIQQQRSPKSSIQCTPNDVWQHVDTLANVTENDARLILKIDFFSNWFLAQQYLLGKDKWVNKHNKDPRKTATNLTIFKGLMKTLIKLRKKETDLLLTEIRQELKQKPQYATMVDDAILKWSSAGSESLTSDIDVNLKGAGSIEAVTLFNKYFKTLLGWPLDPGTVYDVNVYAQDFMTPQKNRQGDVDEPFVKEGEGANSTIAPVEEITELKSQDPPPKTSLAFDAFTLNQDVWSLVKIRTHMTDEEWNSYCSEMVINALGTGTPDEEARAMQVEEQLSDAEHYYREYQSNIKEKIDFIDHSQDAIYQNMRQALAEGSTFLSNHQQEASKKMIAANLIYQEKLEEVSRLRAELKQEREKKGIDFKLSKIKQLGIQLKNILSEAIIYANEAYLTQGAVHFSVIGQQIGKGKSKLLMSDEEHLHSFREQVGDTLKVLTEYYDEPLKKAVLKAGKYIDRMAKSAKPLINPNAPPLYFSELAGIGAAAAKLKSDKTSLEDKNDQGENDLELASSIGTQEQDFEGLLIRFSTVGELRAVIIKLGQTVEADFRKVQTTYNNHLPSNSGEESVLETAQVTQSLEDADSIMGSLIAYLQDLLGIGVLF